MRQNHIIRAIALTTVMLLGAAAPLMAQVKPGDQITPDNASKIANLVSPGNFILVRQGMRMNIVPPQAIEWPPPYKSATEKYASQVRLNDKGELQSYLAGLPFPLLDPNDPQIAAKVMWNFSFRPQYTDDADIRDVEVDSNRPGGTVGGEVEHFEIAHFAFYNNIGRTEVQPVPTDPEGSNGGIRYKFGAFPFLEPSEIRGFGLVRYRYVDPDIDDNAWFYNPRGRRLRRVTPEALSDTLGVIANAVSGGPAATYATSLDPDSYFGFSAKIENYDYKFLGEKPMLAVVHAVNSPEKPCEFDGGRTVCPENWEMRQLYAIEATAKPLSWHQRIGGSGVIIPRRVLYVDSEGWFITASDQYDKDGKLWKTLATYNTYRDRPVPDARVAIYPFKRMFQLALVDQDVQDGFSSTVYMPGREAQDHECWYINMGIVTKSFLDPHHMQIIADH